jgi:hypothetical protein
MAVQGVDPARTKQADQVESPTTLAQTFAQAYQWLQLIELAALNALGDADKILGNDPAGTQVEVTHLAVPHLTFRKTDRQPARFQ